MNNRIEQIVPFNATINFSDGTVMEVRQLHVWYVLKRNGSLSLCHTSAANRIDVKNNPDFISWYKPKEGLSPDEEVARFKMIYNL